ncbi:UvrD-helicase domain-containing protein [Legionella sp. CNM-4043-24]|uniref:UvrD-helicase domain-containing protein n=1 Tax=Legionella sp. CNM-4043-24 TaxID=3421646 RepID=UPI00403B0563
MLKDSAQRQQATDPYGSYIVQAPAGSGKTELLTQRYLRLLGKVSAPEQIVALTFTRKAASEMRERILAALNHASKELPVHSEHQKLTNEYAGLALQNASEQGWQLLNQPSRLKIITIDSLCQSLTQAVPLPEQQTPYAQITESAQSLYESAVRACLTDALQQPPLQQPVQDLLQHLDNRQDKLLDLLTQLLASREQWLAPVFMARSQSRERCEQALAAIEKHELQRFIDSVPLNCRDELHSLSTQIASIENNPASERYALTSWPVFDDLDRNIAAGLAALLLTKDDRLRKGADHHVGLKRGACADDLYDRLKASSKALFQTLSEQSDFLNALIRVKKLPAPHYDDQQWAVLQALMSLLPMLAAHLQLIFRERNEVDFSAISQQALLALGQDEAPTDLTLHMDNSIHHLLVDEFQDTSIQQFQLLEKLVQGWLPGDGKTLFVVGDPMQSIYRFRQAEVGLFLKARLEGIGPVSLTSLELCCNFRSTETLVNWVNRQFKAIFPQQDDMESGAISYHASVAIKAASEGCAVHALQYASKVEEAEAIADIVSRELDADPEQSIAILVRSRSSLSQLIPVLRARGIPFQGVEIEKLSSLAHLRDVYSLTMALLMPASRLHWLALLRSPWCGLGLADLHALAAWNRRQSMYQTLAQLDQIGNLSDEGRQRAQYVFQVMSAALASRYQQGLTEWIVQVIKNLHGDYILNESRLTDLEQFWLLLSRYSPNGQLENPEQFAEEFQQLYSQRITPSRLQIMTIHKSKGLEFDCVILPGLGNRPTRQDKPLLRWLDLPTKEADELILLSPVQAAHEKESLLYDYLGRLAADKEAYEQQRLLYVAVTRAKRSLYLVDCHEKALKGTFRALLQQLSFDGQAGTDEREEILSTRLPLMERLPIRFYMRESQHQTPPGERIPPERVLPANDNSRQSGIVAHELLQWICDRHPASINDLPWNMVASRFRSMGFTAQEQEQAMTLLNEQIQALFNDPIGQWLCQHHDKEQNEYALLVRENNQVQTRIIDRTFYDNGQRWIIDFKTGTDHQTAQTEHRQQVEQYARLLQSPNEAPIRCGLFYLSNQHWVHWTHAYSEPGDLNG